MKRFCIYFLLATLLLSACGRKGRVIPRSKMAEIYAEMFIVDQQINQDRTSRKMADTAFVYEPIFNKYGYSVKDYRASMKYYVQDPNRYARILKRSASIIETELKALKQEKKRLEELEKIQNQTKKYIPEQFFYLTGLRNPDLFTEDSLRFYVDSTGGELYFDVDKWLDTVIVCPERIFTADTVAVCDSIAEPCGE